MIYLLSSNQVLRVDGLFFQLEDTQLRLSLVSRLQMCAFPLRAYADAQLGQSILRREYVEERRDEVGVCADTRMGTWSLAHCFTTESGGVLLSRFSALLLHLTHHILRLLGYTNWIAACN